jgi:hypothetical protein
MKRNTLLIIVAAVLAVTGAAYAGLLPDSEISRVQTADRRRRELKP